MITILLPVAAPARAEFGGTTLTELQELGGRLVMDHALQPYLKLRRPTRMFALVNDANARDTGLDVALTALGQREMTLIRLANHTRGSVCTCLMAADAIDPDAPLVVGALDQVISADLDSIFDDFERREADAGVITFSSRNPKFSYAQVQDGQVFQTAEKRPISSHALVGIYYFRHGSLFIEAAKNQLYKRVPQHQNMFFLSGTINELVIEGKTVVAHDIAPDAYHKFYTPYMLDVFAAKLGLKEGPESRLLRDTERYVKAFNARDLAAMSALLHDQVILNEVKRNRFVGKAAVMNLFEDVFKTAGPVRLDPLAIHANASGASSTLEFKLTVDQASFSGADVITWQDGCIVNMQAYFL